MSYWTPGMAIQVRGRQYLAANGNLDFSFTRQRGIATMLVGGNGFLSTGSPRPLVMGEPAFDDRGRNGTTALGPWGFGAIGPRSCWRQRWRSA